MMCVLSRQSPHEVRTFLSISAPITEVNLERKHGECFRSAMRGGHNQVLGMLRTDPARFTSTRDRGWVGWDRPGPRKGAYARVKPGAIVVCYKNDRSYYIHERRQSRGKLYPSNR